MVLTPLAVTLESMGTFFCDLFFGAHIFFTVFSKLGVGGTSYRNYNFFSSIDVISKTEQLDQLCIVWSLGMMMMMEIVAKRSPRLSDRNIWTHNQQTYTNNLRRRKKHASSKKTCLIASNGCFRTRWNMVSPCLVIYLFIMSVGLWEK